jgi:hypothetical protein
MDKYCVHLCKWIYLFSFLMVLPLAGANETIDWAVVPTLVYWKIGFEWLFQPFYLFAKTLYQ